MKDVSFCKKTSAVKINKSCKIIAYQEVLELAVLFKLHFLLNIVKMGNKSSLMLQEQDIKDIQAETDCKYG